jgi:hypothetical protein
MDATPREPEDAPAPRRPVKTAGFFRSRWRGETPLATLFWRDMLVVGSLVNVATTLAAVGALAAGWSTAAAIGVHLLPLPYNLFLCAAVWRTAGRAGGGLAYAAQMGAALWLVLAVVL